eukprot:417231_1
MSIHSNGQIQTQLRTNTYLCLDELLQHPRFKTKIIDKKQNLDNNAIIKFLKRNAEKQNVDKHKIVNFLKQKGISENIISQAYSNYYQEIGLYEITFDERPLGFSVTMDKRGNNAIVSRIVNDNNHRLGMKIASKVYAINGKHVFGQKYHNILKLLSKIPTPFVVLFKENKSMLQKFIKDTNWIKFDKLYKHKLLISTHSTYTLWRVQNMNSICFKEVCLTSDIDFKKIYNEYKALKIYYNACYGNDVTKLYLNENKARLVMKYYIGENLNDFLVDEADEQVGYLFENDFKLVVKNILHKLYILHSHSILHCDLNVWNIKINEQSDKLDEKDPNYYDINIVNFASAIIFKEKPSNIGHHRDKSVALVHIKGTPGFIAPEIISHKEYSVKSDIFAFGCIMFFLLCNEYAVIQSDNMNIEDMEPNAKRLEALLNRENNINRNCETRIHETTIDFVLLCLQKDAEKRPTTEEALRHQIFH